MPKSAKPAKSPAKKTATTKTGEQPVVTTQSGVKSNAKLMAAMEALNGKHGKGSVILANGNDNHDIDRISTGHFLIDELCGGGIPRGRITEVFGWESSGKSTLVLQIIAQAQKAGLIAAYIDVEHAMDFEYAKLMGIDVDELLFSQPNSAEQALEIMEVLISSDQVGLVVLDSVGGLAARRELEGDVGDEHVAEIPRLLSKELKKMNPKISSSNTAAVFVNQLREKVGVMGYGEKKTTMGGRALKFYASLRIDITRMEAIKMMVKGEEIIGGQNNKLKAVKNKVGPAMKTVSVDLRYPSDLGDGKRQTPGYDYISALIQESVDKGLIEGGGKKSYVFADGTSIRGAAATREYLLANPAVAADLLTKVAA